VAHGRERDGGPQYICRTIFEGGVHLGKVRGGWLHGCGLLLTVSDEYTVPARGPQPNPYGHQGFELPDILGEDGEAWQGAVQLEVSGMKGRL
jgi:hypothetical protein